MYWRIKMKEMKIPLLLFMIATTILLSLHFWYNWDNYFFTPEDDDFHPNEPAELFIPESLEESSTPLPTELQEAHN